MADRTPFADFTRLSPSDSLSTDGFGLQLRNPTLMDYYLRAIVTALDDGTAALANPDPGDVPTVTVDDAGGQIPSDLSISVGYTLLDANGGETELSPLSVVVTQAGLDAPEDAPTLVHSTAAGTLLANSYSYALTLTDGDGGETALGPPASIIIPAGSPTNQITVTGQGALAVLVGAAGWRLWRSVGGEEWHLIDEGVAADDETVDDGSLAADCGVIPPSITGTTRATSVLHVTVPAGQPAGTAQYRIYAGVEGDFDANSLMGTYPIAQLGVDQAFTELTFFPSSPPEQSTTLPGLGGGGGGGGGGAVGPLTLMPSEYGWGTYPTGDFSVDELADNGMLWQVGDDDHIAYLYARLVDGEYEVVDDEIPPLVGASWNGDDAEFTEVSGSLRGTGATGAAHVVWGQTDMGFGAWWLDYTILDADGWDRIYLGTVESAADGVGVAGLLDRVAGQLQIVEITDRDPLTYNVLASVAVDPLGVGDGGSLILRRWHNYLWLNDVRSGDAVRVSAQLESFDNSGYPMFGAHWNTVDALEFSYFGAYAFPREHVEIVAAATAAGTPGRYSLVSETVLWSSRPTTWTDALGPGTDWTASDGELVHRDSDGRVRLTGTLTKSAGTAPVDGEVIATLGAQDGETFVFSPAQRVHAPVVTGDDAGEEIGYVIVEPADYMAGPPTPPRVIWKQGRSSTPATDNPYVRVEGVPSWAGPELT